MFERPGCAWCARFESEVAPVYSQTDEGKKAPLKKIDLARDPTPDIDLASTVRFTPTFVLIDNGREVGRITGYAGDEAFWMQMAQLAERLPKAP